MSELAFRLPSALCALVWAALTGLVRAALLRADTALLQRRLHGDFAGRLHHRPRSHRRCAAQHAGRRAMFAAWLQIAKRQANMAVCRLSRRSASAFLTKGPVAMLIPLAVSFLFCLLRRRFKTWLRLVLDPLGLLLFAAIALPWYALILQREGWAFVQGFFLKHNVSRFSGPLQGHAGSLLYYFPVVLIGTCRSPDCLHRLILRGCAAVWRDDLQCYLLLWFAFVFVFFSLSGTKLPHYILYGMTGCIHPDGRSRHDAAARGVWVLAPASAVLCLPACAARDRPLARPRFADAYYREALAEVSV